MASGIQGHPFHPDPDEITIVDIAQALSKQCRFNGNIHYKFVDDIYSVAQHSVLAEMLVAMQGSPAQVITPRHRLGTLLHDGGEHIFGDMVAPVKTRYPQFKKDESAYTAVMFEKFGLPTKAEDPELFKIIHWADWQIVLMEVSELTAINDKMWYEWVGLEQPMCKLHDIDPDFHLWGPREGRDRFLERFYDLQEYV